MKDNRSQENINTFQQQTMVQIISEYFLTCGKIYIGLNNLSTAQIRASSDNSQMSRLDESHAVD